jgi:hypothetical protein
MDEPLTVNGQLAVYPLPQELPYCTSQALELPLGHRPELVILDSQGIEVAADPLNDPSESAGDCVVGFEFSVTGAGPFHLEIRGNDPITHLPGPTFERSELEEVASTLSLQIGQFRP